QGQVRAQIALDETLQLGDARLAQAAPAALIGIGGIGEAVAEHHRATRQRRTDDPGQVLGTAANTSSSSVSLSMASSLGASSNSRMRSASGVPPGSRLSTTSMPRSRRRSARYSRLVLLPAPSGPSRVMNRPLTGFPYLGAGLER